MISTIEHGLELVRHGIPVFPCKPDKKPLTKNGFKDATTDERQVRRWWGPSPDALIGVPTGVKFDVLDIDLENDKARRWVSENNLPATRMHTTRRGGLHLLFKPNMLVTNSAGKIAPKIDTRGRGGYCVWWPAHGGEVENEHQLEEWPATILIKFGRDPNYHPRTREEDEIERPVRPRRGTLKAMAIEGKINGIIRLVTTAPDGEKNHRLYWAGRRLVEMVGDGLVDEDYARELLLEIGLDTGMPAVRCVSTINSAFKNLGISS